MCLSRRALLEMAGATVVGAALPAREAGAAAPDPALPAPVVALKHMTAGMAPITLEEHKSRIARAQTILGETGLDALVLASGSSLEYFTGAAWGLSERFFGMVLGREGAPIWVTPAFEKERALEQVQIGDDVRPWEEHESPYALLAAALRDRKATARIAIEDTVPFVFADGLGQALPTARLVSGTPVTAGCRMVKDAHEVALMRRASEITVRAHRAVFASLREGMTQADASALSREAHKRLGVTGGSLVLFGPDAAFPHGTRKPRALRGGDVVLIDGGGSLHGYASDITRTMVFGGKPTDRQRLVFDLVRRAQEAAFKAARPGVPCEAIDAAARRVVEDGGFGPGYRAFTHRLGHGIGLDGHEHPYMVRGNALALRPGMTFTNEPGIYIQGEMGIRHEDVMVVSEDGALNLTKWTGGPEEPAVV
ncbi:MAG: M24 family metallopeptidase [Solirubrobacterales bacterium]|jgi:Xaa-Pro dipeptidase